MIRYQDIGGVVYATSYEKSSLWMEFHERLGWYWKSCTSGKSHQLGFIENNSVNITVWTARVNDKNIAFIEDTSQVVDWGMIDKWCEENIPAPKVYAENFVNLFD